MVAILDPMTAFLRYAEKCDIRYCLSGALVRNKKIDSHKKVVELVYPEKVAKSGRYKRISFRWEGIKYTVYEHRAIVALVFGIDYLNSEETVDHVNGDKFDNRIENLELVSHKENYRRAWEEQFSLSYGEDNPASKYSEEEVFGMRKDFMNSPIKMSAKLLSGAYGINHSTYCRIISLDLRWREIYPKGYLEFIETYKEVRRLPGYPKKLFYKKVDKNLPKKHYYEEVLKLINERETII